MTTQKKNNNTKNKHTTNSYNTNNHIQTNTINLALHNIRGLNNDIKRQLWLEYCKKKNINIISITETKLAESKYTNLQLHNDTYYVYTSNTTTTIAKKQESSMGVAIALH